MSAEPKALVRPSRMSLVVSAALVAALVASIAFSWSRREATVASAVEGRAQPSIDAMPATGRTATGPVPATADTAAAPAPALEWAVDFKAARARFDELRWFGEDPARLNEEARQVDQDLPTLLARKAVGPGDALLLKADLLEVLEPDEARRRDRLAAWWAGHPLPRPLLRTSGPRLDELVGREQAVVLEWQTQPSVDRNVRDLEDQLRQLWEFHR